jgi:hypothetical protein
MGADWEPKDVAETEIRGEDDPIVGLGVARDFVVRVTAKADIPNINDVEALGAQVRGQGTGQVLVDEKRRLYLSARTCSSATARAA